MDRFWLLTNTCYGNWLPGDRRGFVGRVLEHRPGDNPDSLRIIHDLPGTPYDESLGELETASRKLSHGAPIILSKNQADVLLNQFQETAHFRKWTLLAVAIMSNHFHIVVGVPGDPNPSKILGDFKSWATRKLTFIFGKPASETWWTSCGSKRKLSDEASLAAAVHYVLFKQPHPLVVWSPDQSPERKSEAV